LGLKEGPFLFTTDPSRNVPSVRRFTSCDLEGSKKFLSLACGQAVGLAGGGTIGLVGGERLSKELAEDMDRELSGLELKDISENYYRLMASKDESSLKATMEALRLAEQGIDFLKEQLGSGRDLWQLAAYVDYRLRLHGCENTNILLDCAVNGRIRPGYPTRIQPHSGDIVVAYTAARYARHWGVVGRALSVESTNEVLEKKLAALREVQKNIADTIRPEMTLEQIEADIRVEGQRAGFDFVKDMPIVSGIGFDIPEFPIGAKDRVGNNTLLQVVLAVDDQEQETTTMEIDMLQVTDKGGICLNRPNG
jgi:Xaa-Pro aminopeptidase